MGTGSELFNLLCNYLSGYANISECLGWVKGRDAIADLERLLVEVTGGLRPESDFAEQASAIVEGAGGSLYVVVQGSQLRSLSASAANRAVVFSVSEW